MKHIIYLMISLVVLVASCDKPEPAPMPEQYDKYIFFSQNVDTRASLIDSTAAMNGKSFGVLGYKYDKSTTWSSAKTAATPNVFTSVPQSVTCDSDGNGTYSPLQGWSNSKKYTFFAYYPVDNANITLVDTDGDPYVSGVPAIKYSLDASSASKLKASMVDVMTATYDSNIHTDRYWYSSNDNNVANGNIAFTFNHCLSSLGVKVKNSSAGSIILTRITLTVDGIKNESIIIPLDGQQSTVTPFSTAKRASFTLDIPSTENILSAAANPQYAELSEKLIFIPQGDALSVKVTVEYTRQCGNAVTDKATYETGILSTALTAGKKHLVQLNFKDKTIEATISTEGWVDIPDVEDTFN